MRKITIGIACLAAAFLPTAAFGHQTVGDDPYPGDTKCGSAAHMQTIGSGAQTFYLDVRDIGTPETGAITGHEGDSGGFSIWIYAESNGHPGMQTIAGTLNAVVGDVDIENCTTAGHLGMASDDLIL